MMSTPEHHPKPRPTHDDDDVPLHLTPEGIIASALFVALLGVIMLQVVGRIGVMRGPVWTEELSRWIWVWMAIIGLGAVERNNAHLRMGIIVEALPNLLRKGLYTLIDLAWLGLTMHLTLIGYRSVLRTWNNTAVSLPLTDAVLYASYPVAALFIIWRILQRLVRRSQGKGEDA
jgi:TRAP-type C4-dicarboxylate transport system permease small subunit